MRILVFSTKTEIWENSVGFAGIRSAKKQYGGLDKSPVNYLRVLIIGIHEVRGLS